MKILLIHDFDSEIGGGEIVVSQTKSGLEAMGHEVKILAGKSKTRNNMFADFQFICPDATPMGKFLFYLYNPFAITATKKAVREFKPDIIHLHTITRFSPAGIRALPNKPIVLSIHDYGLLYPRLHQIYPKEDYCGYGNFACCTKHAGFFHYYFEFVRTGISLRLLQKVQHVVAPTRYVAKTAEHLGLGPCKVIGNPIRVGSADENNVLSGDAVNLLFVGRLEPEKGLSQLIESFSKVHRKLPDVRLIIAGDGSLKKYVTRSIREKGLSEHVSILGYVPPQKIDELYSKSSVLLMPSLWPEPFGMVGLEAMAHGLPVIGSGRGGMDWLKDSYNGLIANPDHPDAASDQIIKILHDHELYDRLSAHARSESQARTLEVYSTQLALLYPAVLKR